MRLLVLVTTLVMAVPVSAQDLERWMLPITPSTVHCGYESHYRTTLVTQNTGESMLTPHCFGFGCSPILSRQGVAMAGPEVSVPLPSYIYLPADDTASFRAKLLVESSHKGGEDRFYTEIPIVRESEFRTSVELIGIRTDADYRQTLRIYGRDTDAGKTIRVDIYDFDTGELLLQPRHVLYTVPVGGHSDLSSVPSFTMECDLTKVSALLRGRTLRLVITSESGDAGLWAFASITSNESQHFYTVLPI